MEGHRDQAAKPKRLKPLMAFGKGMASAFREPQFVFLLATTISVIGCATVFYHWQEGWRWVDALYFSVVTIATVGFGDFSPKTDGGKLFTVVYIFAGVGLFVATAAALAGHIIRRAGHGGDGDQGTV